MSFSRMITQCKYDGAQMENKNLYRYGFMGGGKKKDVFHYLLG